MFAEAIFSIQNNTDFEKMALRIFRHQYINNQIYQRFCNLLGVTLNQIKKSQDIPHLPIEFFKQQKILSSIAPIQKTFTSSGTTGSQVSQHHVTNLAIYEESFNKAFEHFYGAIESYTVLALLPSYLERDGSSLVYMADQMIRDSKQPESGFYLNNLDVLAQKIKTLTAQNKKILLLGVSFALWELAEQFPMQLSPDTVVMETGGMKGRRKEITRNELHKIISGAFGIDQIHSEYGMTELLSQAYSTEKGIFRCPPWMRVNARDPEDALTKLKYGKTGGINIIDLANVNSCAFIATQDLGKIYADGRFEILGRFDHSDIRGCNLMALS